MTTPRHGPFESERQARETEAVQAVRAAFDADPGAGKMAPHNHRMMEQACVAAGVELGAFDHRILLWLAGYEPTTCAVIAGIIARAAQGAVSDPGDPDLSHDDTERRWLRTRLLALLPRPTEMDAEVADVLAAMPGDVCSVVFGWLAAARSAGAP